MKAACILIISGQPDLAVDLASSLEHESCDICFCPKGDDGVLMAQTQSFDLIVLDQAIAGEGEYSYAQRIRMSKQTPLILVSADGSVENRIKAYHQGADDFISRPFHIKETTLKINALLRLSGARQTKTNSQLNSDQLILDKSKQKVYFEEQELVLTPTQFKLLWLLVENRNQIMSKPYLYQAVLDREFFPYDRSIDMHFSRIRKKLMEKGMVADRLTTIHGKGYRYS
ncbi:response regulator transcription factor [Catenovulum sp. SM1970]|uniref:response regulator transcription factor n=1 Tax=Marinifaba aquimaris TaxID=2741323 RepID=UPI001571B214|nr:response regulator transcription factor [Marinifaba aquimaris]NTS78832.1 response regulator transcription factor [Marinifaba aquimaris]